MKKLITMLAVLAGLSMFSVYAQEEVAPISEEVATEQVEAISEEAQGGIHQALKQKFIEGGAGFMSSVALCLILGLAIAIERIIYLAMASTDSKKLLAAVEKALEENGVEAAKEICRNTRGPVASIFYQGLMRIDEGIDVAEKSIIAYGGVQAGMLEKNVSWIGLFIGLAPMLGFMGTVIGMIKSFQALSASGAPDSTELSAGISEALINTAFGIATGAFAVIGYNFYTNKIDHLTYAIDEIGFSIVQTFAATH